MNRKPDDWMPLHIGAYLADTTHLTRDLHGAYLLLLMAYWRRGEALPADDGQLAAIAKASPADWRRIKPVIAPFFTERDDRWFQKRCEEELARAREKMDAKSRAGRAGAQNRWHKDADANGKKDGTGIAGAWQNQWQTDAPITKNQVPSPNGDIFSLRSDEPPPAKSASPEIPDWIPRKSWDAFVKMRKKMKAPLTDEAIELQVSHLKKLREAGEDVGAVLDQSTMNSWKSLIPLKQERGGQGQDRKPASFGSSLAEAVRQRHSGGLFATEDRPSLGPADIELTRGEYREEQ